MVTAPSFRKAFQVPAAKSRLRRERTSQSSPAWRHIETRFVFGGNSNDLPVSLFTSLARFALCWLLSVDSCHWSGERAREREGKRKGEQTKSVESEKRVYCRLHPSLLLGLEHDEGQRPWHPGKPRCPSRGRGVHCNVTASLVPAVRSDAVRL